MFFVRYVIQALLLQSKYFQFLRKVCFLNRRGIMKSAEIKTISLASFPKIHL